MAHYTTETSVRASLTALQQEILQLVGDGLTFAEIAAALGMPERTAKAHCDTLRHKFRVGTKLELAEIARRPQEGRSVSADVKFSHEQRAAADLVIHEGVLVKNRVGEVGTLNLRIPDGCYLLVPVDAERRVG